MITSKLEMPTEEELQMANEFLRLRGSSLKKAVRLINESIPEEPLCLCFRSMEFSESVKQTLRNAAEHPERLGIVSYNSFEEYKKAMDAL